MTARRLCFLHRNLVQVIHISFVENIYIYIYIYIYTNVFNIVLSSQIFTEEALEQNSFEGKI
jgi:hypothetical protein